jgi:serine/threonine protein kinase
MSDLHENAGFIAPEAADLAPFFPGYEIQGLIATGGMGAVYCAMQKSLDRKVALKILPKEFSKDAAFCAGFESEAKAMARLNHPNLIGVYDFGEVNGMLYIMMEFVPGKSLYHSAHGIAISPTEVIRLVTGVCNGLAHAHENGIIHRDIKPSNILLDLQAQPKIGDFGLASPIERKIQEGEIIYGTPHYTAPEVVQAPHSVDYRADIFSVGVLLHELLTGKLPADDPRPASTICRCDPRFDTIIRRATQPIPAARYSSASQIASDLGMIAASLVPKVPRTSAIAPVRRVQPARPSPTKAKKSSFAPLLIMLLAVGASIGAVVYFANKTPTKIVVPPPNKGGAPKIPVLIPEPQKKPNKPDNKSQSEFNKEPRKPRRDSPPDSEPEPEPEPERPIVSERPPDTGSDQFRPPIVSDEPKFDVPEFFERALKIMQERAKPIIAAHDESLAKNVQDYGIEMLRQIRRIEIGKLRTKAEDNLEIYIHFCKEKGNRIPLKIKDSEIPKHQLASLDRFVPLRDEFVKKEEAIDNLLYQSLCQLSATYILGLEKQIERLKPDNDSAAIELIKEEIVKTRTDEVYFPNLITDAFIPPKDLPDEKKDKDDDH